MDIQWYPGHMTKTRRMIVDQVRYVDIVVEVLDARIPISSRNPDVDDMVGEKPRLIVLNRADQADPELNRVWSDYCQRQGRGVLLTDCKSGAGVNRFAPTVRSVLSDKIAQWQEKGMTGKAVRAMVLGVPNVGKSTFINQAAHRKSAKAQNRPGVTRGRQWITVDRGLELLDTPGILWPKFEDQSVGLHLAYTGAVKDDIMDLETLGSRLMGLLCRRYPEAVIGRYKIDIDPALADWELLEAAGRRRGFLISGGEVDLERMARVLLEEFRSGKLGRFTLETPEDLK